MSDRLRRLMPVAVVACALVVVARPVSAQFVQQGPKLVGSGATGNAGQGGAVALSADGNTAIVGGPADGGVGAAWIWTRSGTTWTQQGNKLVGTGAGSAQVYAVALSADGNTAAVVGHDYRSDTAGGVWIWTRSGATWTQQGGRLVGDCYNLGQSVAISADGNTTIVGAPGSGDGFGTACVFVRSGGTWTEQANFGSFIDDWVGWSVAISGDGNTALVGSLGGAVWVVTRSGGTWTRQGPSLTPTDGSGSGFGSSLGVSADGNTAVIGGPFDNAHVGATWVFTRSGSTWTQQGPKLVGTGTTGNSNLQGVSVAISGDGNTIIEGGDGDGGFTGAAWIFTRANDTWSQLGSKLVGTGAVNGTTGAEQGVGVGLSSDGRTAIVSGPGDNSNTGAAWIYARVTIGVFPIPDLDGDGKADLAVWRASTGTWYWLTSTTSYDPAAAHSRQWGTAGDTPLSGDLDGDGKADLVVWRPSTGTWYWLLSSTGYDYAQAGSKQWGAPGDIPLLADIDGDGQADLIVWRPSTGTWYWVTSPSHYDYGSQTQAQWGTRGDTPLVADMDADGKADLVIWRPSTGTWYWLQSVFAYSYAAQVQVQWGNATLGDVPLLGDFDGDGVADPTVWRSSTGTWYWLPSASGFNPAAGVSRQWGDVSLGDVPLLGDFDGDRRADVTVWRGSTGTWYWLTSSSGYNYAAAQQRQWGNQALGDMPR